MSKAHDGSTTLRHSFDLAFSWLLANQNAEFVTDSGTPFNALASHVTKGHRVGEPVIRIFQGSKEYSRAYACCWGLYTNCNKTRVGMYCQAIDSSITRGE